MISFLFIEDHQLNCTWIYNQIVIFKPPVYCYLIFWFQNTKQILYCFAETWKSIIVFKIRSQSH